MGLSNKKEEQLRSMPVVESKFFKSKDGNYIVHKTTITTIRPVAYMEKVLTGEGTIDTDLEGEDIKATLASDDEMVVA